MSQLVRPVRGRFVDGREAILTGGLGGGVLVVVTLGLVYLALAQFVLWLNDPQVAGANFWPAAGLTMGSLILLPTRRWPWALAAIAVAEASSNTIKSYSFDVALWLVIADTVEPLVGATLIRRFGSHGRELVPIRGLIEFIALGVIAAPLVGGSLGTIGSMQSGGDYWASWPRFVVGDALGVLVVAPVLLTMRRGKRGRTMRADIGMAAATAGVSLVALHNWTGGWDTVTPYLVILPLTWAALRSGIRGTAWSVLAMAQIANVAVAIGTEPFAATSGTGYTVTLLQTYLAIVASTTLILASAASELTDRDALEEVLRRQALHDVLTGLPNRLYLAEHLEAYLVSARARGLAVAMCVVDFDAFKEINDSFGHPGGDEYLVEAAHRLEASVSTSDLVTRIGGDEFVVLLAGPSDAHVEVVTARIVDRLARPMLIGGREARSTVSIGVAMASAGSTFDTLFRDADTALYRAKSSGGNQVARLDGHHGPVSASA
ncbi:MAG: diguanylate cyclase [Chloroflexi bacterium]|nr:diguanylate cyclase [Chloroflexota bacterium]MDA1240780.1 diguanylate cyclase [Chloroflexota bacterium]